ncbi:Receptor-like serine/threonine-protein kinase ALE2 [Striga hermonthica]|uniref:Receptor-like serine/threonine-protein kinase ALE2 n=1 Tax=Striga hermonthica TaxID=68872 RepID=A0A9N7N0F3_STRHE|nr:Receptor-like serine/threonine-protein kinase ALE2 [Striga hermonthica]
MLRFLLPVLLALFPTNLGTASQVIYLSPSHLPLQPFGTKSALQHVSAGSLGELFSSFLTTRRQHNKYLSAAPAPSPVSLGPVTSRTDIMRRHRHHRHKTRVYAVSPSTSTNPGCNQICTEPLTSVPFGSPCMCVIPMRVRLLLGVPLYAIFPEVTELEIEVAAGTYLKQSQVAIIGANADTQNQERAVVDIYLIPLGEKFDNTTAMLTYERFLYKNVPLNKTLFGDYDVMNISYPGLPSSPPFGEGPHGSAGNQQYPVTADFVGSNQKINPRLIIVMVLSTFVLLVVACAALAVLLKCRTARRPSNVVGPVFTSTKKKSGLGSMRSSSPTNSTSTSLISAMPASILSVKTFSLTELEKATENFSQNKVLGQGGFGQVYHGLMPDGTEVAVKLLARDNQNGDREFIAEIEMLSRLHHRNLVKLIGICIEQRTRCLVYELVPNGSVESHLHGDDRSKGPLDWDARLKIALGAARGLAYLHEDSNPRVIHRDFKASNVLLEDDFTPKVSDFGLAREATEGSHHISTRVMGTFGYVAPEYAMTGHLLVKSDVYSYGVILLELLTGRKPVDMSQSPGQENLVTWARPLLANREGLEQLADPTLAGTYNFDDMAKVAAIAAMCVHPEVTHRPFMGEVVQALKLIYNDTDGTCADALSLKEDSSTHGSDLKPDFTAQSDNSWWNDRCGTPGPRLGRATSFVTMEYNSGPLGEMGNRPLSSSGLARNRSGPLRTVRRERPFRLQGSVSEHGEILGRCSWDVGAGYDASF